SSVNGIVVTPAPTVDPGASVVVEDAVTGAAGVVGVVGAVAVVEALLAVVTAALAWAGGAGGGPSVDEPWSISRKLTCDLSAAVSSWTSSGGICFEPGTALPITARVA